MTAAGSTGGTGPALVAGRTEAPGTGPAPVRVRVSVRENTRGPGNT